MATVTLQYGAVDTIPWTYNADITGKRVVFVISRREDPDDDNVVMTKTSDDDVAVTQATPTAIGTIAIAPSDFGSTATLLAVGRYAFTLWHQDGADEETRRFMAKGSLTVAWTNPKDT